MAQPPLGWGLSALAAAHGLSWCMGAGTMEDGARCEFRMFCGGRALLAAVEITEFTRKWWILKLLSDGALLFQSSTQLLSAGLLQ